MPNWNEVFNELVTAHVDPYDTVMTKYMHKLHESRGRRNIIAYYSGWLQRGGDVDSIAITEVDKNAFMAVVHKLDFSKGLDLILHAPGGVVEDTESIGDYLRGIFGTNIEVFVPQMAMSAGTMLACVAKTIHMGKQSSIGPIDPQFIDPQFGTISAGFIIDEFNKAAKDIDKKPNRVLLWDKIIGKYPPSFLLRCENSIKLAKELVASWLKTGMFAECRDKRKRATSIANKLANYRAEKSHSRHIGIAKAKEIGLNITDLEKKDNDKIQDLVLTVHHTFMHTFANTPRIKIIANHKGLTMTRNATTQSQPLQ